jgi:Amt family ammonium transporter
MLAIVIVGVFSFGGSFLLYKLVDILTPLRVAGDEEELGLDLSQHGEIASVAPNGGSKKAPMWGLERTA